MTNILVTGGAGYIGATTCYLLDRAGFTPVVIDNLSTGFRNFVKWGPLIEADIGDQDAVAKTIDEYKPSAVIHFAASAYVGESMRLPLKYYKNNVAETIGFFSTLISQGVNKLVFSSSCATYGQPSGALISESDLQRPINPYGRSKLMVESILSDLADAHGFESVILRYFNAAGAIPEANVGEMHAEETHLIPLAIDAALTNGELVVHGDDYGTADGTPIRDYIHVRDLGNAHISALNLLLSGKKGDSYNLGTGVGFSVLEILAGLRQIGINVPVMMGARRPGDPAILVADSRKAQMELGWSLESSSLSEILETALAWQKTVQKK